MEMKVLQKIMENCDGRAWEDVVVLHVNHCMDNSFYFNRMLEKLCVRLIFVAVPYNNHTMDFRENTYGCFHAVGQKDCYGLFQNGEPLHIEKEEFMPCVWEMIKQALAREILPMLQQGKRLLILEDGGYHYDVMKKFLDAYPELQKQVIGVVEQTTSGTRRCMFYGERGHYPYPCVSIARSKIKMDLESVFIGQRIVEELNNFLYEMDTFVNFHSVMLMGYGIVGRNVAKALEGKHCSISAYDPDPMIRKTVEQDGILVLQSPKPEWFAHDTILIGCAGVPSFTEEIFQAFMEGEGQQLYLASGSSKDIEFGWFLKLVKEPKSMEGIRIKKKEESRYSTQYEVFWQEKKKNIYLLAKGLPVNFYREDVISLTYRMIDLIFAEMFQIGAAMCSHKLPSRLLLLGSAEELTPFLDEEALTRLWFQENDFFMDRPLQIHPNTDYLRERLMEK